MDWQSIRVATTSEATDIERLFDEAWTAMGMPEDAALFEEKTAQESVLYFSPGAARIFASALDAHHPSACDRPRRSAATLRVGHADAGQLLAD